MNEVRDWELALLANLGRYAYYAHKNVSGGYERGAGLGIVSFGAPVKIRLLRAQEYNRRLGIVAFGKMLSWWVRRLSPLRPFGPFF